MPKEKKTKNRPLHPLTARFRKIKRQNIEQTKRDKEEFKSEAKSDTNEITPLYAEFLKSKPLYPDNETALVACREKLNALAARYGKTVEDYLNEARAAAFRTSDHLDALQLSRAIGFFLSKRG